MSKLHVNRDRQNLGQFTPEQISEGLVEGRFLPTDLAWREGMETWQPLSTFTDLPAPEPTEADPHLSPYLAAANSPASPGTDDLPWARRSEIGFLTALRSTISEILGSPAKAFGKLPETPKLSGPYSFYLLTSLFTGVVNTGVTVLLLNYAITALAALPEAASDPQLAKLLPVLRGFSVAPMIFMLCVIIPIAAFVAAGMYHATLMLFGGANASFQKTFAVTCYALGVASLFQLLPCCGPVVQVIWGLVLLIIGLGVAHRTDTWRATLAVLIPFLLCCGGYFALSIISATASGVPGGLGH